MPGAVPGHVVVRSRALEHALGALAADGLGVMPRDVGVRISDERGLVRVEIRAPYADRTATVLDSAADVQRLIGDEGSTLTGARIGTVTVRITDTVPTPRRTLL